MKIGTFLTIENSDWKRSFEILKKYDFDFFELLPENLSAFTISSLEKELNNKEIIIHAPFIEPNLAASSQIIRTAGKNYHIKNLVPLIKTFHPQIVTVHFGYRHKLHKEVIHQEYTELSKIIPNMTFENMPNKGDFWKASYPSTESEIDEVIKKTKCPMTFDVGHFLKQNFDVYKLLEKYLPHIRNIHIHDVINNKDHQTIGTGILELEKFMSILKKNKYSGYLSIELIPDNLTGVISSWKLIKKLI